MNDAFWFPVDGGGVLLRCGGLSAAAVGCWFLLRVHLLRNSRLPCKRIELVRICHGADFKDIRAALSLFDRDDAGFFDKDLEALKCKVTETKKKRAEAGAAGAAIRWGQSANMTSTSHSVN